MAGDINAYSLGIEFKLNATQATSDLNTLTSQMSKLQESFAAGANITLNTGQAENAMRGLNASVEEFSMADVLDNVRQLIPDVAKELGEVGLSQEKWSEYSRTSAKDLGILNQAFLDLYEAGIEFDDEGIKMWNTLLDIMEASRGVEESVAQNQAAWEQWGIESQKAVQAGHIGGDLLAHTLGELHPKAGKLAKTVLEYGNAFGLVPDSIKPIVSGFLGLGRDASAAIGGIAQEGVRTGESLEGMVGKAPIISKLLEGFGIPTGLAEGAEEAGNAIEQISESIGDPLDIFGGFADAGQTMSEGISGGAGDSLESLMDFGSEGMSVMSDITGAVGGPAGALGGLSDIGIDLTSITGSLGGSVGGLGGALGGAGGAAGALGGAMGAAVPHIMAAKLAITLIITEAKILFKIFKKLSVDALKEFIDTEEHFRTATYRIAGSIHEVTGASQQLRADLSLTEEESVTITKAMIESGVAVLNLGSDYTKLTKTAAKFAEATGIGEDTTAKLAHTVTGLTGNIKAAENIMAATTATMAKLGMSAAEAAGHLEHLAEIATKLKGLFGPESIEKYGTAMLALTAEFKKIGGGITQAKEIMEATTNEFHEAAIMSGLIGQNIKDPAERLKLMHKGIKELTEGWNEMDVIEKQIMADITNMSVASIDMMHNMKKGIDDAVKSQEELNKESKRNEEINKRFAEAIGTLKQAFTRLFVPIKAMLAKVMSPFVKLIEKVLYVIKPVIKAIGWFVGVLEKMKVFEGMAYAATNLLIGALMLLGAVISGVLWPLLIILPTIVAAFAAIGMAAWAFWKIVKIVFFPLIVGVKLLWRFLKFVVGTVIDLGRAIWGGLKQAVSDIFEPIRSAIANVTQQFNKMKEAIFGTGEESKVWGAILKGITTVVAFLVKWAIKLLFWPLIVSLKIAAGLLNGLAAIFGKVADAAVAIRDAIFKSSAWGIVEGIKFLMTPINWLISAFKTVAAIAATVGKVISAPFKAVAAGAKAAGKGVLGIAEKIPVVGKAAGWLKGKLFNSPDLLGLATGATLASRALATGLGPVWGEIGSAVMQQFPVIGGFFSRLFKPMKDLDKVQKTKGTAGAEAEDERLKLLERGTIGGRLRSLFGLGPPSAAPARPVQATLDNEMGRESKSERELRELVDKIGRVMEPLDLIVALLKTGKDSKRLVELLEEYLPKISERPSELGPAYSQWG
jgi:hypothetical protein